MKRTDVPLTDDDFNANYDRVVDWAVDEILWASPIDQIADLEQMGKSARDAATGSFVEGLTLDQWQDDTVRRLRGWYRESST